MKKGLLLSIFSCLLVGCGVTNDNVESADDIVSHSVSESSTVESVHINEEKVVDYTLQDITYSVPESWPQEVSNETRKYYYPEWGMLIIEYQETDATLDNDDDRADFLSDFEKSVDEFELLSESKRTVADRDAYEFEFENKLSNSEFATTLVAFDYKDGIVSIYLTESLGHEVDYSTEFEAVIQSIELDPENGEESVSGEFDGINLVVDDFELTITDYEIIPAKADGNENGDSDIIVFYFDVTLTNDAAETIYNPAKAWIRSFQVYQGDEENALTVHAQKVPKEMETQLKTIEVSETVSSMMSYELTDSETPVTLGTEHFGHHEVSIIEEE